jgi:hypothetical protein
MHVTDRYDIIGKSIQWTVSSAFDGKKDFERQVTVER